MATSKKLVIVESPAKAKTIGKYLGDDYEVMASVGHVRDLAHPRDLSPAMKKGLQVSSVLISKTISNPFMSPPTAERKLSPI